MTDGLHSTPPGTQPSQQSTPSYSNKNYVSPYSMFYRNNQPPQSQQYEQQISYTPSGQNPHLSTPQVTYQSSYSQQTPQQGLYKPPDQNNQLTNNNPFVPSGNPYDSNKPNPYSKPERSQNYTSNQQLASTNYQPQQGAYSQFYQKQGLPQQQIYQQQYGQPAVLTKEQEIEKFREDMELKRKFSRLSADDPNLIPPNYRKKIGYCRFMSSVANVGFFIYFIFKFNTMYLSSLSRNDKIKTSIYILLMYTTLNLPFNMYINVSTRKAYNDVFGGLSNAEVKERLAELDRKIVKVH